MAAAWASTICQARLSRSVQYPGVGTDGSSAGGRRRVQYRPSRYAASQQPAIGQ